MSGLRKECKIAMKMSFSGKVKEELASQLSPARHCQIAEFAALLLFVVRSDIARTVVFIWKYIRKT